MKRYIRIFQNNSVKIWRFRLAWWNYGKEIRFQYYPIWIRIFLQIPQEVRPYWWDIKEYIIK